MKTERYKAELRRLGVLLGVMLLAISGMVWGMVYSEGIRWVSVALAVCVLALNARLWNLAAKVDVLELRLEVFEKAVKDRGAS